MFRSRWRRSIRERTPTFLYRLGFVIPKVADCGDHEWYRSTDVEEACYHCLVTRASADGLVDEIREWRRGNRLNGLSIRELIDEGRR